MDHAPFASAGMYYRHSGRFAPGGVVMALGLGALAAILLGAAYAYVDLYNPIAGWVTFLVIGGTGFLLGWILGRLIKSGKIRNVPVAMLIAALSAGLLFLSSWEVWLFAFLQHAGQQVTLFDILTHPAGAWDIIVKINAVGAWSLSNDTPTGIVLALLWLIEGAALVGIPLWVAWGAVHEAPFCEKCNQWCASRDLVNVNPGNKAELRAKLEGRDFAALADLGKAPPSAMHFWRAYFQGCAGCDTTQTLCVDEHVLSVDKNGKLKSKKKPIVARLVLTPEDTVAVATAAAVLSAPPAPEPAPKPPAAEPAPEAPAPPPDAAGA